VFRVLLGGHEHRLAAVGRLALDGAVSGVGGGGGFFLLFSGLLGGGGGASRTGPVVVLLRFSVANKPSDCARSRDFLGQRRDLDDAEKRYATRCVSSCAKGCARASVEWLNRDRARELTKELAQMGRSECTRGYGRRRELPSQ